MVGKVGVEVGWVIVWDLNSPKCPVCGRVMIRYGRSASGAQRWRCSTRDVRQVGRIDSSAKQLEVSSLGSCGGCFIWLLPALRWWACLWLGRLFGWSVGILVGKWGAYANA